MARASGGRKSRSRSHARSERDRRQVRAERTPQEQPAKRPQPRRTESQAEDLMFFPKLRKRAKWVFVLLAAAFGIGFVGFGIGGTGGGGGIADAIGDIFGRTGNALPSSGEGSGASREQPGRSRSATGVCRCPLRRTALRRGTRGVRELPRACSRRHPGATTGRTYLPERLGRRAGARQQAAADCGPG